MRIGCIELRMLDAFARVHDQVVLVVFAHRIADQIGLRGRPRHLSIRREGRVMRLAEEAIRRGRKPAAPVRADR